jgi:hypothetical protein
MVVAIMLATTTLVVLSFNGKSTDRIRSAARIAQSAFLGAKDRALHATDFRGLRLTVDPGNTNLVTGFVYVQPNQHDPYPDRSIQLEYDSSGNVTVVRGYSVVPPPLDPRAIKTVDWFSVNSKFATPGQIRIPAGTGQWYAFTNYWSDQQGNEYIQLAVPFTSLPPINSRASGQPAFPINDTETSSCDIQFIFDVLPFHQPVSLPAGVVIDLRYCSQNVQSLAQTSAADIVFSPRGSVAGATGGSGAIYLCLRLLDDALLNVDLSIPSNASDNVLFLAVNPQTGLVQTYAADFRDQVDNVTGQLPPDGIVDDLLGFAKQGKAAGR